VMHVTPNTGEQHNHHRAVCSSDVCYTCAMHCATVMCTGEVHQFTGNMVADWAQWLITWINQFAIASSRPQSVRNPRSELACAAAWDVTFMPLTRGANVLFRPCTEKISVNFTFYAILSHTCEPYNKAPRRASNQMQKSMCLHMCHVVVNAQCERQHELALFRSSIHMMRKFRAQYRLDVRKDQVIWCTIATNTLTLTYTAAARVYGITHPP
jgi:hypothetical protein